MTLEQAIEEAKRRVSRGYSQRDLYEFERVIVNAVASGQLVSKAEIERGLADPTAVHYSMLRGTIAKPSLSQIVHIYAEHQLIPKADADLAVAEALRKAGEFVAGHAAVCRGQISPLSQKSDPPLTKAGASAVADRNAKLRADADRFDLLAAAISGFANQDHLAEVQALRAERDALMALRSAIAVKGGSEHYPTEEAYLLACAAIEKHRARAEAAEAEVARLKAALTNIANTHGNSSKDCEIQRQIARAALTPKGDTP